MQQARAEAEAAHRWARFQELEGLPGGGDDAEEAEHEEENDGMHDMEPESDDEHVAYAAGAGWAAGEARRGGGVDRQRLPLHHFLRLMAGARVLDRGAANGTNDDLVAHLRKTGAIKHEDVARALRVCARDMFVPREHAAEALIDTPVRLSAQEFNISAPHMHASCLEALRLKPGHRFLDVGSGCGVLTAAAALLVGQSGASVGIDTKTCAVELGRANVRRLAATSKEFSHTAASIAFHKHNCFIPSARHKGRYDRVHVGATCPSGRLAALTALLGPQGGAIVVPVQSDLRLITVAPDGSVSQRILSQVRYSDLEVPTDAEVVASVVEDGRAAHTAHPLPPSSFHEDCAAILGPDSPVLQRRSVSDSECSVGTPVGRGRSLMDRLSMRSAEEEEEAERPGWVATPMKRLGKLLTACSGPSASPPKPYTPGSMGTSDSLSSTCGMLLDEEEDQQEMFALDEDALGPPDAKLVGSGWDLPIHWAVLRERCEQGRARSSSGMRDATAATISAPDATPRAAAEAFVAYLYSDRLEADPRHAQGLVDVLHLAIYFGAPRLAALTEAALAATLASPPAPDFDPVEAAPVLLALADDNGLPALSVAAADFCVHHYAQVAPTAGYAALSKRQSDVITAEACTALARYQAALQDVARRELLPEPDNFF